MDWKELQFAAQQLGVRLHTLQVQKADAFDQPFKAAMQDVLKHLSCYHMLLRIIVEKTL